MLKDETSAGVFLAIPSMLILKSPSTALKLLFSAEYSKLRLLNGVTSNVSTDSFFAVAFQVATLERLPGAACAKVAPKRPDRTMGINFFIFSS